MRKLATVVLVAALAILSTAQIPLPPSPTKAQLWSEVGRRLEVDRAVMSVIVNDEWLSKRVADAGIADISKTPSNQPLPHDILTGWTSPKRFKLVVVDTEKESQLATIIRKLDSLERSLEESRKKVALNSGLIQGQIKRVADKIDPGGAAVASGEPAIEEILSPVPPKPTNAAAPIAPEHEATIEPAKPKKKPFFPPINIE